MEDDDDEVIYTSPKIKAQRLKRKKLHEKSVELYKRRQKLKIEASAENSTKENDEKNVQTPATPKTPIKVIGVERLPSSPDLFVDEPEPPPDPEQIIKQKLQNYKCDVKPCPDIDIYASGRFIQGHMKIPNAFVRNSDKFNDDEDDVLNHTLPPSFLKILDAKSTQIGKSDPSVPVEIFSDQNYGGLGENYCEPTQKPPKFSTWTYRTKQKSLFGVSNEPCNALGQKLCIQRDDFLSQIPSLVQRKKVQPRSLETIPEEVRDIVQVFEEFEVEESSPDASPIHLNVIPPIKTYKRKRKKASLVFPSPEKPVPVDDEGPLDPLEVSNVPFRPPNEMDFRMESNILNELAGLSQSFKEGQSLDKSLASPDRNLDVLHMLFPDDSPPSSNNWSPKSQKSIHLSDFGSQEVLQDTDFGYKRDIGTSPIAFVEPSPEKIIEIAPPINNFTGFALASGTKLVPKVNKKAMSLFDDILDEYPLDPLPTTFGGFQAARGSVKTESSHHDTSLDEELPADFLKEVSHIEKAGLQRTLNPKRVNQLRTPAPTTKSPVIESPEGFMSALMSKKATTSTPVNRPSLQRQTNVKPIKLLNRIVEGEQKNIVYDVMTSEQKEMREVTYARQAELILNKPQEMKSPSPGSLYRRKMETNRLKWKDFVVQEVVQKEINYKSVTSAQDVVKTEVTFSNARSFRFNLLQFVSKSDLITNEMRYEVIPNVFIVPDEKFQAGFQEFLKTFFTSPGTDKTLFTPKWFMHHYIMSVFKLYRYSQRINVPSGVFLTPSNVIEQIKYRYDREIDKVSRSAFRRCLERDDVIWKRLVLEVIETHKDFIMLSDGWYAIRTEIDEELKRKVANGDLRVGRKIITTGAELRNHENPCHPIDMPENVRLKIHYNSTRPAPVNSKLGYQRDPLPLVINLNDVKLHGGLISSVLVYVTRVYPPIFHDKLTKTYHSEHQEMRLRAKWETERQLNASRILEETINEVKTEFSERHSLSYSPSTVKLKQARRALEGDADPSDITNTQQNLVRNENDRMNDEIVKRCYERSQNLVRNVTPCLRLRVLDVRNPTRDVLITLWSPKDVFNPFLKENSVYKITDLIPNVATSDTMRLFSTNKTSIKPLKNVQVQIPDKFPRKITEIENIQELNDPTFNELDVLGLIISIQKKGHTHGQIIYLANARTDTIMIKFPSTIDETGNADVIKEGGLVMFENLEWRAIGSRTAIPTLFFSPLHTKVVSVIRGGGKKVSLQQQKIVTSFKDIDLHQFTQELSKKLGSDVDLNRINESLLGESSTSNCDSTSVGNQSTDQSIGSTVKRRRLGNQLHTSGHKRPCTR